jgi:serine/threonine protein kinase
LPVTRNAPVLTDIECPPTESAAKPGPSPAPPVEIRPGLVLRDRFTLGERIAAGGIGELYQAIDRRRIEADYPDPFVAIKVLSPKLQHMNGAVRILQYEAILAQRLIHPNLVRVFDIDRHAGIYFMTMEWLRGESLARRLKRTEKRPLPWAATRRILHDVGAGLGFAHQNGVVHGDIKPANIFLTSDCQVKIVDFGLACSVGEQEANIRRGPLVLTPAYASCEIHERLRPTVQDDVYSLAVMAYQMIAGSHPFGNRTALEAESARLRPRCPPGLSALQWESLRGGLKFRRGRRPESVAAMIEGLVRKRKRRLLRPWPPLVRVASILYATGLVVWYYGPNQLGGSATVPDEPSAAPKIIPGRMYEPPATEQNRGMGMKPRPGEAIIALRSLSEQDVRLNNDPHDMQET